jgi:hypothetical protein
MRIASHAVFSILYFPLPFRRLTFQSIAGLVLHQKKMADVA